MEIFVIWYQLVLLFLSCTLVQLQNSFALMKARVDKGNDYYIYSYEACISKLDDNKFKISTSEREEIFETWDLIIMVQEYVRFETVVPNLNIECLFKEPAGAKTLLMQLKNERYVPDEGIFLLTKIMQLNHIDAANFDVNKLMDIKNCFILVELNNRFVIFSREDKQEMVFSSRYFNVSKVLSNHSMILTLQIEDISTNEIKFVKFLLFFKNTDDKKFFDFVKQTPNGHTNDFIPVDIPNFIENLF